jgi:processive 1,2-diacylglycerol beta-glucosyltransferase
MIELRDVETGRIVGSISEDQLKFLLDQLEEESDVDTDYYLNKATIEMFEENGADPELLNVLWEALGEREDMEIAWARK